MKYGRIENNGAQDMLKIVSWRFCVRCLYVCV